MRWLLLLLLAGCGSGAVTGPVVTTPLSVLPGSATVYSGQIVTFQISGGKPPYIVGSSNQGLLPVSGVTGPSLTIIPGPVSTATQTTLIVSDSVSGNGISVPITVLPSTVSSTVSIIPTDTSCQPAACSGSDAEVVATLALDGPIPNRPVRFEATSGEFGFITDNGVQPTTTVLTDSAGKARARIRISAAAQTQTALLRVVDVETGAFTSTSFTIAPGGSFFASPSSVTFSGTAAGQCAANITANVYVFGGAPPYTVTQPGAAFRVDPVTFTDSFTVAPQGICVAEPGLPVTVQDATGRTLTVHLANIPGTQTPPPLVIAPESVQLASCSDVATVSAAGGEGKYVARSGHNSVSAKAVGSAITITRVHSAATPPATVEVAITSGSEIKSVTVNLSGTALTNC